MYLHDIRLVNEGPIENCSFDMPFNKNGNPKPLILVGSNGSGKTIFISSIVDALYEMYINAGYRNPTPFLSETSTLEHNLYKISSALNTKVGASFSLTSASFYKNPIKVGYIASEGISLQDAWNETIKINQYYKDIGIGNFQSKDRKQISQNAEFYKNEIENGCYVYFPANRYEIPLWQNEHIDSGKTQETLSNLTSKPLIVQSVQHITTSWLLDIILDKAASPFFGDPEAAHMIYQMCNEIVAKIMKNENCVIGHHDRTFGTNNRLTIGCKTSGTELKAVCPKFNSLSLGQSTLLNMFLTIIRYADNLRLKNLAEIEGIVIIDEIEAHLNDDLIVNTLPSLIKMFPKVQFVITSHSPMFLLGMQKEFGDTGFQIREMPTGIEILPEEYSEFRTVFSYISNTETFTQQINDFSFNSNVPLVITEGKTDWKHILHAFKKLGISTDNFEMFQYQDSMGDSILEKICSSYSRFNPNKQKIIAIFDADNNDIIKVHGGQNLKDWGNDVYSFCIPIPEFRKNRLISIEMYYSDEILNTITEISGQKKKLYFSNEVDFDNHIILQNPKTDIKKITIKDNLEGYQKENEDMPNVKTKNEFADEIIKETLSKEIDYTPFKLIYDKINEVLQFQ